MPAILDIASCTNCAGYPCKRGCKYGAIKFDPATKKIKIEWKKCPDDCPGPCVKFCDHRRAIKFGRKGQEFDSLLMQYSSTDILF